MTPEEREILNSLVSKVQKLEEENLALKTSSGIPLENDNALQGRGFIKGLDVIYFNATDFAATGDTISAPVLQAPDLGYWTITVDNTGALGTSSGGTPQDIMGEAISWGRVIGGPFAGSVVPLYTLPRTF